MEHVHLKPLDGTSILQSFCFMHNSSTCGMDITMLLIVLLKHIIHVFHTIHMAHIIKWEQITLMGHVRHVRHVAIFVHMVCVGHVLHMKMKNVGQLLQMLCVGHMLHMSPIHKWFTHEWTFQMNINMCLQFGPKLK
jgi:hypothetical protein